MTLKQQLTVSIFAALALAAAGKTYPDLPVALADGGGALIGDTAYVGLGSAGEAFFALDLKAPQAAWQALPPFPGGARSQPVVAALDGKLYVFGGLQKDAAGCCNWSMMRTSMTRRKKRGKNCLPARLWDWSARRRSHMAGGFMSLAAAIRPFLTAIFRITVLRATMKQASRR